MNSILSVMKVDSTKTMRFIEFSFAKFTCCSGTACDKDRFSLLTIVNFFKVTGFPRVRLAVHVIHSYGILLSYLRSDITRPAKETGISHFPADRISSSVIKSIITHCSVIPKEKSSFESWMICYHNSLIVYEAELIWAWKENIFSTSASGNVLKLLWYSIDQLVISLWNTSFNTLEL